MATNGTPMANAESVYRVIVESDEQVLTVQQIADELGVSNQTVRNKIESVTGIDGICERKIGKAYVYWYEDPDPTALDFDYKTDLGIPIQDQLFLERRYKLLHAKQMCFELVQEDDGGPDVRAWLWNMIYKYMQKSQVYSSLDSKAGEDGLDWEIKSNNDFVQTVGEEEFAYYAIEHPFFDSELVGEVVGMAGLREFEIARGERIREIASGGDWQESFTDPEENVEYDKSLVTDEHLDEIYPSLSELLGTAETVDAVISEAWGVNW